MGDPPVEDRRKRIFDEEREEGRQEGIAEFYGYIFDYDPQRPIAPLYDEFVSMNEMMEKHPDICDDDFRGNPPWMRRI